MDPLIAATALEQGAVLVSHSVKESRRVRGLRFEDWY
jgi:predicted nucleic acid-binding protein